MPESTVGSAIAGLIGGTGIGAVAVRWLTLKHKREESVDSRFERLIDELQKQLQHAHKQIDELSRHHLANASRIADLERMVSDQSAEIERLSSLACGAKDCNIRRERRVLELHP